jgi:hypothetical protein
MGFFVSAHPSTKQPGIVNNHSSKGERLMAWLMNLKSLVLIGHIIGVVLGAGGVTMSDVLFLSSIHDNYLDPSELKLLKKASKIVIAGLILLCLTGGAFFLLGDVPNDRFWAKLTLVSIATMNGFVMHRKLFPLFTRCAHEKIPLLSTTFLAHLRLLVSTGIISACSWYGALILGAWKSLPLSYFEIMAWYGGLMAAILLAANLGVSVFNFGLRTSQKLAQATAPAKVPAEASLVLGQVYSQDSPIIPIKHVL